MSSATFFNWVILVDTTRRPREGERDGEHYYFVDRKAMEGMISNGNF